ncbi:hypothetical protein SEVIR_9G016050v4 [Setaria viridis]|uniref:Secreted protein n=1 Tax=Setaria viridis TaxID=4556 RepID=A0A4U6T0M9_SETVI|nr:hypothetical protein SEVIR_9G016050v2 [Setaria viridis]
MLLIFVTPLFFWCRKWILDLAPRFPRFSCGKSILHFTLLCVNFLHDSSVQITVYACFPEVEVPRLLRLRRRGELSGQR